MAIAESFSLMIQSLDGAGWRFRRADARRWLPAIVPGCVHADLQRNGRIPDPFHGRNEAALRWIEDCDWVYALDFTVSPPLRAAGNVDLVADGLDTVASIRLNGDEIGRSENMFVSHRWPVKSRLRRGRNRLEIRFGSPMAYVRSHRTDHVPREINDPVGGCTRIRKQQCSFGWDWGPRLPTSGIWRSIRLQGWHGNRLESVRVIQRHRPGAVTLELQPRLAVRTAAGSFRSRLRLGADIVTESDSLELTVRSPRLWWPGGQGGQPLYTLEVEYRQDGRLVDTWTRRIGLRTIELDRHADRWGESFQFRVNGRAIFAKGANWIPAHALTAGQKRADYEPLLRAAAAAHMNMIRVWGGGVYEHDDFYDLCDELGLLVWQDFMFACTLYPGDPAFLDLVAEEAKQQVTRLRHHASLALWCGNNEIESLNADALRSSPRARRAYDALFDRLLPRVVAEADSLTPYWRSSPLGSQNEAVAKDAPRLSGDWHDWDVWHARQPVKDYERSGARFVSEFGMQSFASPAVAATFSRPEERNVFSPTMENHQKNPAGNAIILDYVCRRYRFPRDYAALAYLSQMNQACCMKVAVEHWRRSQPRTMGALYWQLNDCWPVASWSSIEFGGGWKPLHHAARRFFTPVLVSAHVLGDEARGIGNGLRSEVRRVDLFTVSDHPARVPGRLEWELWHLGRRRPLRRGTLDVILRSGEARRRAQLDFAPEIARHGRERLALSLRLVAEGLPASEDVVLFTAPRNLDLAAAPVHVEVGACGAGQWTVRLSSPVYQHGVVLDLPGLAFEASDNAFDLLPGRVREIVIGVAGFRTAREVQQRLVTHSLVDSYSDAACSGVADPAKARFT